LLKKISNWINPDSCHGCIIMVFQLGWLASWGQSIIHLFQLSLVKKFSGSILHSVFALKNWSYFNFWCLVCFCQPWRGRSGNEVYIVDGQFPWSSSWDTFGIYLSALAVETINTYVFCMIHFSLNLFNTLFDWKQIKGETHS
jgi:hypothetical protein